MSLSSLALSWPVVQIRLWPLNNGCVMLSRAMFLLSQSPRKRVVRAGYEADLDSLMDADVATVTGLLSQSAAKSGYAQMYLVQVDVWTRQVAILQNVARYLARTDPASRGRWRVLLEYEIPRRQKRPDAVLLADDVAFVIEFKHGADSFDAASKWQVEDYALDLRDFHALSRDMCIVPVLCATDAPTPAPGATAAGPVVWPVQLANSDSLAQVIETAFASAHNPAGPVPDAQQWSNAPYRPVLTIVEAAERLYGGHDVREISHSYADNLQATTDRLVQTVQEAQTRSLRMICFVTGVPGAGKTLTGLNVVHDPALRQGNRPPGIFLSGNGPLVKIVRAALVQSSVRSGLNRRQAQREVRTFIHNVHTFLETHVPDGAPLPPEHVVVFDEAQRAWNAHQVWKKRKVNGSEPDLMLSVMARQQPWCVIVALVGGGQEIHIGEAGLVEWGRALSRRPEPWTVYASPEVLAGEASVAHHHLFDVSPPPHIAIIAERALHLNVSVRSPRAQHIAEWVNAVLAGHPEVARSCLAGVKHFPLVLTRDLNAARSWLRDRSRKDPFHRCGLLASSGSLRHRAYGLELSSGFRKSYEFRHWFLAGPEDLRSCYALEVAATEFECQGLELDWTGVCWGDDLVLDDAGAWKFRKFAGTRWRSEKSIAAQQYLINKYRVLLTRAREGMLIWVPPGDLSDATRDPASLERVHILLKDAGVQELEGTRAYAKFTYQ